MRTRLCGRTRSWKCSSRSSSPAAGRRGRGRSAVVGAVGPRANRTDETGMYACAGQRTTCLNPPATPIALRHPPSSRLVPVANPDWHGYPNLHACPLDPPVAVVVTRLRAVWGVTPMDGRDEDD
ncbi:hypothetical protein GUJ93_ZPchr0010g8835 [Zizania palustris]|uniref:Uncharacterized protein n=1 Tax=Zizania palustris TaxID=103762 RepID=A0A8J5WAV7_ZIZPA|nr:hypothetical protein GUJ93_ZPchr0010g8835 [Zizania palustris]